MLINVAKGRTLEHQGIRVELLGVIESTNDNRQMSQFIQLVRDLEPPGTLTDDVSYDFAFNRVEKLYETYSGNQIRLRYYINAVINRHYNKITEEEDFVVYHIQL